MEDLQVRRTKAEETFNNLTKQKERKQEELNDIDTELARLQGEWRLLNDLIAEQTPEDGPPKKDKKAKVADTIDATDVKGA